MGLKVSYLVPVYNEEEALPATARAIVERLATHPGSELVMVEKDPAGATTVWPLIPVRFVPLTGPSGAASS